MRCRCRHWLATLLGTAAACTASLLLLSTLVLACRPLLLCMEFATAGRSKPPHVTVNVVWTPLCAQLISPPPNALVMLNTLPSSFYKDEGGKSNFMTVKGAAARCVHLSHCF